MAVHSFPYIFDRPAPGSHPWHSALAQSLGTPPTGTFTELTNAAIAANWRIDPRVSQQRETEMLAHWAFVGAPARGEWLEQVDEFFGDALCCPGSAPVGSRASVYRHSDNINNRVSVLGHERLVHIGSIPNMLRRIYRNLSESQVRRELFFEFRITLPSYDTSNEDGFVLLAQTLCDSIELRGPDAVRDLARYLANSMGDNEPPWWATFAYGVKEWLTAGKEDWDNLCRAIGLGHLGVNHTLLLWRYKAEVVTPLYRPTSVEANDSPYHFPSPENGFGIAMPLDIAHPSAPREVIHAPLRGELAREFCTGIIGKLANAPILNYHPDLLALRQRQRRLLDMECVMRSDRHWLARVNATWP